MVLSDRFIWFGLKCCLYCGSLDRGSDGLCRVCSEDLESSEHSELFNQEIRKLQICSLYHWIPGRQEVLSRLIHELKGVNSQSLWHCYGEKFVRRQILSSERARPQQILLVPAPARNQQKDHAYCFAQALMRAGAGMEIFSCLEREGNGSISQKKKSRLLRQRVALSLAENITIRQFRAASAGKLVVFVDDVVTTGATASAVWRTLGKPRDFAVWALAQRGLSCGASRDLL